MSSITHFQPRSLLVPLSDLLALLAFVCRMEEHRSRMTASLLHNRQSTLIYDMPQITLFGVVGLGGPTVYPSFT
jgi:hypothetical protein